VAAGPRRRAASLPAPPPVTWHGHFQRLLARSIEAGSPSLERVAKQMAVSPRTLQRQLAEHGTTWRAELNAARERRVVKARQSGTVSTAALARQLAYSDPRSLRRALRRWDNEATDVFTTP
jgi:AraC-like DNA-binding protein